MALLLPFFAVFVLAAVDPAVGQQDGGRAPLSIDCGLDTNLSGYKDQNTGFEYVSDATFVDDGENHGIANNYKGASDTCLHTLRSFPRGTRNCYALPTVPGDKYLVRLWFLYGNYDNASTAPEFNLQLGGNDWTSVSFTGDDASTPIIEEAMFVAWASWAPVCLVKTGDSTPFVSAVELRWLPSDIYPAVMPNQSVATLYRANTGTANPFTRYPDDKYDRFWWSQSPSDLSVITTQYTVQLYPQFPVFSSILHTAVEAATNRSKMSITWDDTTHLQNFTAILHIADFQDSKVRRFDIYLNGNKMDNPYSPNYLADFPVYSPDWFTGFDGNVNITLAPTDDSELPPMLNAYEIYALITHDTPVTFPKDFDALMAIKLEYGIKKNWMGDPCFPSQWAWEGVKCRDTGGNITRIISIDLSDSNLHGIISENFTLLTALEYLNLSGNQLNGPIPDSLCKNNNTIPLHLSYKSDGDDCNKMISSSPSRNKTGILAISIVAPVAAMVVLALAYFIWRVKRKQNISTDDPPEVPELKNVLGRINYENNLQKHENRRFTYDELQRFTNNFKRFIGQGGFGQVYYGCLEDNTEVAVKMRSESSSHGLDEFLAEVQSLTTVHHRNLVSLVGYCWEKDRLALVYEYMPRGNLYDHLRGKIGNGETLNWATRVRVLLEAAQGLDYLHKGCNLPMIHGDVKTNNILLDENVKAKIADFGLSKTYHSDTQTHISGTPAGSVGYIDPEYYNTGRLTESSDVYSFGVVLLEVSTGESPIIPGQGHIIQRVKQKIATGNISSIADARLGGTYDVSSMWKVIDTAIMCTTDIAAQRVTMATVVVQLKESLALEEAHGNRGNTGNLSSDIMSSMSTFGPSAR